MTRPDSTTTANSRSLNPVGSAKTLETRMDDAIAAANFNVFELTGFRAEPMLAIKAGMGIGYRMALDELTPPNTP